MDLKEYLLDYVDMQKEIKDLEEKIQKLEISVNKYSIVETSSLKSPFQKHNIKIDHADIKKTKTLNYYKVLLQQRYDRLLEQQIKVEEFIDRLPTSRLRQIFENKYINGYSYIRIAIEMNKNRKSNYVTAEGIRKEHDRYLNNVC